MIAGPAEARSSGAAASGRCEKHIIWINGAGQWLIVTSIQATLGRSQNTLFGKGRHDQADIGLTSAISRRHATIHRIDDCYLLAAHASTAVDDMPVASRILLSEHCTIRLADSTDIRFDQPTPLSASATLSFGDQDSPNAMNGAVLMADACLIGPGRRHHINCPDWNTTIVLARTRTGFAVRSSLPLVVDGRPVSGLTEIRDGQTVAGPGGECFRIESLEPVNQ